MKKMKRAFSLVLSLVLILGMVPVQGYATDCLHEQLVYSADKDCITESCKDENCDHQATATLALDETASLAYTGEAIQPLKVQYSDGWLGEKDTAITYDHNVEVTLEQMQPAAEEQTENEQQPENPEEFQENPEEQKIPIGTLTIGGASATKTFKITKGQLTVSAVVTVSYGDEAPNVEVIYKNAQGEKVAAVLNGQPKISTDYVEGMNAETECSFAVELNGASSEQYELTAENGKFTVGQREVTLVLDTAEIVYDDQPHTPKVMAGNLAGADEVGLEYKEVTQTMPGTYAIEITGLQGQEEVLKNYKLPEDAKLSFTIQKAPQDKPTEVTVKDDKIIGVNDKMEYKTKGAEEYTQITGEEVAELKTGIYYVRYAETETAVASEAVEVMVLEMVKAPAAADAGETKTYTVTLPAETEQIGYTLAVEKTTVDWDGSVKLTFTLNDRYIKGSDFGVMINDVSINLNGQGEYTISNIRNNIEVTVTGVYPLVAIKFDGETFLSTVNKDKITFDKYFNQKQDVVIEAPKGADVSYAITEKWTDDYAGMPWDPYKTEPVPIPAKDGKTAIFYARVDWGDSTYYASTNGMTFDTTAPTASITSGRYYTSQKVMISDLNLKEVKLEATVEGTKVEPHICSREEIEEGIPLKGDVDATYKITAKDEAKNTKTIQINMEPIENLKTNEDDLGRLNNIINQSAYATDKEKEALEEIKTNKNAYLTILKIQALPKAENIQAYNAEHRNAYEAAQELYDGLTSEQKKLIKDDDLKHLNAVKEALVYKITTAADKLKWEKSSGKNFVIETNVKGIELKTLLIDDDPVTKATTNYEFDKVTGKLTIKSAFLQKSAQTVGKHYIQLVFKDGGETSGTDQFEIQKAGTNPKTGDNGILFWMTASLVSVAGLAAILSGKKKHYQA